MYLFPEEKNILGSLPCSIKTKEGETYVRFKCGFLCKQCLSSEHMVLPKSVFMACVELGTCSFIGTNGISERPAHPVCS